MGLETQEIAKGSRSKQNGKKVSKFLLQSLRVVLQVTAVVLLGFPIHTPNRMFNSLHTKSIRVAVQGSNSGKPRLTG